MLEWNPRLVRLLVAALLVAAALLNGFCSLPFYWEW